jgi:hypothetical protein
MHFSLGLLQPVFIGVIFLIYAMYRKITYLEQSLTGQQHISVGGLTFESVMHGILAGFIIGLIINYLGIYIQMDVNTFLYLWMTMLLLSFINTRNLWFSYAGGILALSSLIFKWPHIHVSGLLALVGLLNLAEAFLIFLNGYKNAIPVFVKQKEKVVGAFFIQKFWPIPIAMLLLQIISGSEMPSEVTDINNPQWWPLMKEPELLANQLVLFSILTMPTILGYSEIAVSAPPEKEVRNFAIYRAVYSIALIVLAVISSYIYSMQYIAAIFALVVNKAFIVYRNKRQESKEPFFSVPERGVRVLDVFENGPAHSMGMMSGDIILRINNKDIMTHGGIMTILNEYPRYIWVDILRNNKNLVLEYRNYVDGIDNLRIMIVPRDGNVANIFKTQSNYSLLSRLFKKFRTNNS